MNGAAHEITSLFIIFLAALLGGEAAQRLKMPSVVGQILAGCLIGPQALNLIEINDSLRVMAELGAIILLFMVGLDTRLEDLRKVGKYAVLVGVLGVALPFIAGWGWAASSGFQTSNALFTAAAFVATSVGITARVLQEAGVLNTMESRIILGAAVIDDILAMLLLGVVTSFHGSGTVHLASLAFVLLQAVGFVGIIAVVGTRVMKRSSGLLEGPINPLSPLTISLAICLGLAALASFIGLAAIIGAFLAGMVLAETVQREALEKQIRVISEFLIPFFFVLTGAEVDLSLLADVNVLSALAIVTALAIISKILGCGLGALSLGRRSALIIGTGMVPRGEVGIIIASLGLQEGILPNWTYTTIIAMSLLTSIAAPPALTCLFRTGHGLENKPGSRTSRLHD